MGLTTQGNAAPAAAPAARSVEDKAGDILAMARSLVTDNRPRAARSRSRRPKQAPAKPGATTTTEKPFDGAWRSETMRRIAAERRQQQSPRPPPSRSPSQKRRPKLREAKAPDAAFDADDAFAPLELHVARGTVAAAPAPAPEPADLAQLRREYDARFSGLHAHKRRAAVSFAADSWRCL
mmetsp:Transcript_22288/g.68799  ORF Transcript_22288/g.68799 Transcript_22288/m.68799 type:complete len:180 (+) Transcript_22288:803-1342(+)